MDSSPTSTKKCNAPCPTTPAVCSPPCRGEETCIVTVINNLCECPEAKCVNINNIENGNNNNNRTNPSGGNNNNNNHGNKDQQQSSSPSMLGPILGSLLGLGVIGLGVFLFLRRRRQRRRTNNTHMLHSSSHDDSLHSLRIKSQYEPSSEMAGHRDVIRIAYIPSMISDSSPIQLPSPTASRDSMSPPKAAFMAFEDNDRNKHDSIASTVSTGVLETAMMTMVSQTKTAPQVMRLNTIKRDQSDLIHRSNSLHSNNSLRRTRSQRKLAQAREKSKSPLASTKKDGANSNSNDDNDNDNDVAAGQPRRRRRGSLDSAQTSATTDSESEDDKGEANGKRCDGNDAGSPFRDRRESLEYTPAVMVTGPSARSSMRSTSSGPGGGVARPRSPTMVLGPLPIEKQHSATTPSTANSTSTIAVPPMHIPGSTTTTKEDYDDDDDPLSLLDIQGTHRLRPWARGSMASGGTRDSTFSTASDARSSTRGDGEEIMIFWDGHRNSTRSSVHHEF